MRSRPLRVLLVNAARLGVALLAGPTREMHRIRYQLGRHMNNYGEITWWDMLFGTYENPAEWVHHCGFDDDREQQLLKVLAYNDVHV